jgi:hypothetical protein
MSLAGKVIYGSWKDGSDIYKDVKGYYVVQWNPVTEKEYKKHLKGWKPTPETRLLCRDSKKVYFCNTKTKKSNKGKTNKRKTIRK